MKKVALFLALLMFAVPAWAGITVTASQPNPDVNEIIVEYACGDANLPRAFALEIEVNGVNTVLSDVYDIHSEFYVYPGSIVISGGEVTDFGTPVADSDSNSKIIEMGSLYADNDPCHTDPPLGSGILFKFTIDSNDCNVVVSLAGNAARGTVVMEDPDITYNDEFYVTYVGCSANVPTCDAIPCQCFGDVSGSDGLYPADGQVDLGDFTRVSMELMAVGPPYIITPVPPELCCADMTDATAIGCPDNQVDLGDFTAMSMYLMGVGPPYIAPCMPPIEPCPVIPCP